MIKATATGASSANTVTATVNGVSTTIHTIHGLSVTANDVLLVEQIGAEWWAVGIAYDSQPAPPPIDTPPAPPPSPPQIGQKVITPVETRSYRSTVHVGWRTDNDDVYQGEYGGQGLHTGCVFYGSAPRSLAGATVTSAYIHVQRPDRGGSNAPQSTTMWLITQATRPSGAPTRGSSTSGPSLARGSTNNSFAIPTSWAQSFVNGTAGGLAFYESDGSPYVIFAGKGSWSPAFSLVINWRRN